MSTVFPGVCRLVLADECAHKTVLLLEHSRRLPEEPPVEGLKSLVDRNLDGDLSHRLAAVMSQKDKESTNSTFIDCIVIVLGMPRMPEGSLLPRSLLLT
ncbi:hypothetical protein BaRGS_00024228 [Batillaria attramentaria]|uniref:Uncharacterized protein n=1 Tax=Batillaria attramentaria TaxID=370345 RepID=A0ABD0KBQ8_9CAEN